MRDGIWKTQRTRTQKMWLPFPIPRFLGRTVVRSDDRLDLRAEVGCSQQENLHARGDAKPAILPCVFSRAILRDLRIAQRRTVEAVPESGESSRTPNWQFYHSADGQCSTREMGRHALVWTLVVWSDAGYPRDRASEAGGRAAGAAANCSRPKFLPIADWLPASERVAAETCCGDRWVF